MAGDAHGSITTIANRISEGPHLRDVIRAKNAVRLHCIDHTIQYLLLISAGPVCRARRQVGPDTTYKGRIARRLLEGGWLITPHMALSAPGRHQRRPQCGDQGKVTGQTQVEELHRSMVPPPSRKSQVHPQIIAYGAKGPRGSEGGRTSCGPGTPGTMQHHSTPIPSLPARPGSWPSCASWIRHSAQRKRHSPASPPIAALRAIAVPPPMTWPAIADACWIDLAAHGSGAI